MSLSAEALAQLEGLDLQEVRTGLAFVPTTGSREPLTADLSSDELSGLRNWDLSGVLAGLNSLTFEAAHPELTPSSEPAAAETAAPISDVEELPEWLRPAEAVAPPEEAGPPVEETAEPAPSPEESVEPSGEPGGPTAEEAAAGLAAAAAAGQGTQVLRGGEVVIPPASQREARKRLSDRLSRVDWKGVAFKGVEILGPAVFSAGLYEAFPQLRNGMVAVASTAFGLGALTETAAGGILMAEKRFPRLARLARLVSRVRGKGYLVMQLSASALAGMAVTDIVHHFQLHAVQQAGAGETGGYQTGPPQDVEELQQHAAAAAPGGETALRSPDAVVGGGQPAEQPLGPQHPWVGRLPTGETAMIPPEERSGLPGDAEVLAQQAAAQAEAARQAALEAATRVVEVQPGDTLTGLIDAAGGNAYGKDFTNTVLQSADVLTGPQNPNRDMARALVEFIKAHPGGVNWRDAINGVGSLAKEIVGGVPLKDAMAQATRMIYPGQEIKVVIGAGVP